MSSERKYKTFEDLEAWKACRDLRLFVSKEIVPRLPKEERFHLSAQVLDAARSTTANIAEGYGRFHYRDAAKFMSNSRGSCQEVLDHLITANDEDLISTELLDLGRDLEGKAVKLLNGYMKYLRNAANEDPRVREESAAWPTDT